MGAVAVPTRGHISQNAGVGRAKNQLGERSDESGELGQVDAVGNLLSLIFDSVAIAWVFVGDDDDAFDFDEHGFSLK